MTNAVRWMSLAAMGSMVLAAEVNAQSLLERLERRLNDAGVAAPLAPRRTTPEAEPVARGYLGLTADQRNGHIEVISVRAGGPADIAGVKPGDRLVSIGEAEVAVLDDIGEIVGKLPAGSRIELIVLRGGRQQTIAVTLGGRGDEALPAPAEREPLPADIPLEAAPAPATLGVRALPISIDLQRRYGLTVRRGAVIESIQPGSAADRYGLPIGAAIVAIDGARVDTPDDLAVIIGGARAGDTIEVSYYVRDQVYRKQVRLAPAGGFGGATVRDDRPLLRQLGRALGEAAPLPGGESAVAQLQAQLQAMQARIDALEQRLADLEGARRQPAISAPQEETETAPAEEAPEGPQLEPLVP